MRALLVIAFVSALSPAVHAADDKAACVAAHADAQLLRKKHALVATQKALRVCAQEVCPALVQKDCTRWLGEVEAEQPTVVVVATDGSGNEVLDVRVLLDGKPLVDHLDGSPLAIDPGEHVLRLERGGKTIEQRVVLHDGEKLRKVSVTFGEPAKPAPAPASPAPAPAAIPTAAWVFGAIGIASLGSFAYFGLAGRAKESSLSETCAPSCSSDDVSGVRTRYLVADVSLGVSVVSLALATYFVVSNKPEQPTSARSLDVRPVAGGAFATFSTSF